MDPISFSWILHTWYTDDHADTHTHTHIFAYPYIKCYVSLIESDSEIDVSYGRKYKANNMLVLIL